MTLEDWLDCTDRESRELELSLYSDRKLHLLTAAFLRRVWASLPYHDRAAVEATEEFADGKITAHELAWVRSLASRESGESLWVAMFAFDDYDLLDVWDCCPCCDSRRYQYECRVARQGGIMDGVRRGVREPAGIAAGAAGYALYLENPAAARKPGTHAARRELQSQFAAVREILGEYDVAGSFQASWRTDTVRLVARGIYRDRAFENLPILADALQDAGCDDEDVLWHCRRPGGHARGCWVLDLAMGVS